MHNAAVIGISRLCSCLSVHTVFAACSPGSSMDPTFPLGSGRCCHVLSTPGAVGSALPHISGLLFWGGLRDLREQNGPEYKWIS